LIGEFIVKKALVREGKVYHGTATLPGYAELLRRSVLS